jgi:hypothetical protein
VPPARPRAGFAISGAEGGVSADRVHGCGESPPAHGRDGLTNRPKHVKTPACLPLKNQEFTIPSLARTAHKSSQERFGGGSSLALPCTSIPASLSRWNSPAHIFLDMSVLPALLDDTRVGASLLALPCASGGASVPSAGVHVSGAPASAAHACRRDEGAQGFTRSRNLTTGGTPCIHVSRHSWV